MLAVQFLVVWVLLVIFYQDNKARLVYGLLFPITAVLLGILHYNHVETISFYVGTGINILFISLLMGCLWLYSKMKMKMPFLNGSFGLGDMLFFYAICFAFPNLTFMIVFVCAVCFALVLHLALRNSKKHHTVPLAGYMALFFALLILSSIFYKPLSLYLI